MTAVPHTIRMHAVDNVAIVGNDGGLDAGTILINDPGAGLVLRDRVPQGHKVALVDIPAGAPVLRYGIPIGHALKRVMLLDKLFGDQDHCLRTYARAA